MDRCFLIIAISIFTYIPVNSQTITMEKSNIGYKFTQYGINLKFSQLDSVMKINPKSHKLIKSAHSKYVISQVMSGSAGILLGVSIGTAINAGKLNWTLIGIGSSLIAVGYPLSKHSIKKAKKAVDIYNANLTSSINIFQPEFKLVVSSTGVGIAMSFL